MNGIGRAAGGVAYIWYSYPLTWLGLESTLATFVVFGLAWLGIVLSIAAGTALMLVLLHFLFKCHGRRILFLFPFLWVLGELLGAIFFSIYTLGPGSAIGTDFSFGYVGYTVAHLAVLYPIVLFFGVYGLSFLLAGVAYLCSLLLKKRMRTKATGIISVLAVSVVGLYLLFLYEQNDVPPQKVIVIDTRFDLDFLSRKGGETFKIAEEVEAVVAASKYSPDIILLPEDSRLTPVFTTVNAATDFLKDRTNSDALVVDTARVTNSGGETVLRAFYHDLENEAVYLTDKQYLIPQGEYVTYLNHFLLAIFGQRELLGRMERNQSYRRGEIKGYDNFPESFPGVLFCSESISPAAVGRIAEKRQSTIVLHPVSHARFSSGSSLNNQLDAMLRVHAIRYKKTIISAGNLTQGKVYRANGNIERSEAKISTRFWDLVEYNI